MARCRCCGLVIDRYRPDSLNRTLALTVAGVVLFVAANALPFLGFSMGGLVTETNLISGVMRLWEQGNLLVAILVFVTAVAAPALQLGCLLYVLVPLNMGWTAPHTARVFRLLNSVKPWSMMEVFLLGILVAVVKLAAMADIIPGLALWSFALLIVVLAWAQAALDPRQVWDRVEFER